MKRSCSEKSASRRPRSRAMALEAFDHEGHLILDPGAPVVLVVDPEAMELLDGEEVGELSWRAVTRAQVVRYHRLLVLVLAHGQLEVGHGGLGRLHHVADASR